MIIGFVQYQHSSSLITNRVNWQLGTLIKDNRSDPQAIEMVQIPGPGAKSRGLPGGMLVLGINLCIIQTLSISNPKGLNKSNFPSKEPIAFNFCETKLLLLLITKIQKFHFYQFWAFDWMNIIEYKGSFLFKSHLPPAIVLHQTQQNWKCLHICNCQYT